MIVDMIAVMRCYRERQLKDLEEMEKLRGMVSSLSPPGPRCRFGF